MCLHNDLPDYLSDHEGTIYRRMTIEEVSAYASVATAVGTLSLAAATGRCCCSPHNVL